MTRIVVDPYALDETANVLRAVAGEYDALGPRLATGDDLCCLPAPALAWAEETVASIRLRLQHLATELHEESIDLKRRSRWAMEGGGLENAAESMFGRYACVVCAPPVTPGDVIVVGGGELSAYADWLAAPAGLTGAVAGAWISGTAASAAWGGPASASDDYFGAGASTFLIGGDAPIMGVGGGSSGGFTVGGTGGEYLGLGGGSAPGRTISVGGSGGEYLGLGNGTVAPTGGITIGGSGGEYLGLGNGTATPAGGFTVGGTGTEYMGLGNGTPAAPGGGVTIGGADPAFTGALAGAGSFQDTANDLFNEAMRTGNYGYNPLIGIATGNFAGTNYPYTLPGGFSLVRTIGYPQMGWF